MGFLGNSDIILTISVLFLGAGLASMAGERRAHMVLPAIFIATLLLFLTLHRYGSRLGSGSPALQLIFIVMLLAPVLLRALPGKTQAAGPRHGPTLYIFAGLMAGFWIFFLFAPWTAALRTAAHPAVFAMSSYAMLPIVLGSAVLSRAGSVWALLLFYAFLFSFGTGSLEGVPESTGVRVWNGLLWALPIPAFLLLSRGSAGLGARLALGAGILPCPLLILWPGLPAGRGPGIEFHAWWAVLAISIAGAIALEMHLKKAART